MPRALLARGTISIMPKKIAKPPFGLPAAGSVPGLVWAYRFSAEGVPEPFEPDDTFSLSNIKAGFVWLHLDLVDARAVRWCELQNEIPQSDVVPMLVGSDPHPRLEHHGRVLYGVLADRAESLNANSSEKAFIRFAAGGKWLVTGRRQPAQSMLAVNLMLQNRTKVSNPIRLFELVVESIFEDSSKQVEAVSQEIDRIEDSLLENRRLGSEEPVLGRLRRQSVHLHRDLLGLRVAFRRLTEFDVEMKLPPETVTSAARILQRIDTLHGDVHVVQQRAQMLQERFAAQVASEINRNLYILSIISSLMLPPTFLFGLWGVNAGGVPMSSEPYGFWVVLAGGILASFAFYKFFVKVKP